MSELVTLNFSENRVERAVSDTLNYFEFHSELSREEKIKAITKAAFIMASRPESSDIVQQ